MLVQYLFATLFLSVLFPIACHATNCTKGNNPYVGLKVPLKSKSPSLVGEVIILDNCSFAVQGFKFDPPGTSLCYWYGSIEEPNENGFTGNAISASRIGPANGNAETSYNLASNIQFADFNYLVLYDSTQKAVLSYATLQNYVKPKATTSDAYFISPINALVTLTFIVYLSVW